jgi:hypothetical protein
MSGSKLSAHLAKHCLGVRPGTSTATAAHFLPCSCTAKKSINLLVLLGVCTNISPARETVGIYTGRPRLISVPPGMGSEKNLLQHPCTAPVSFASSSPVHLPVLRSGSKLSAHLARHRTFVQPGTITATASHFLPCSFTASVSFASSSSVHLPELMEGSKVSTHL